MAYRYILRQDILFQADVGFYLTYGLDMFDEASERVFSQKDISLRREAVETLISHCDCTQPSPDRMREIIETFMDMQYCL